MNAILKLIDNLIEEEGPDPTIGSILVLRDKIESLPPKIGIEYINKLQRYTNYKNGSWGQFIDKEGQYICYDDLISLLTK